MSDKSNLEEQIEENLKKVYQQKLSEEIPAQFFDLIEKLRKQESRND